MNARLRTMGRRAVSPMVATMLLIFFAVALGVVIMTWGTSYAAQQGDMESKREEASIRCERFVDIEAITESLDTCVSGIKKRLRYTIKNTGEVPIDGFRIILIGEKNLETTFFDEDDIGLQSGEMRTFNRNYDYTRLGHLGQVEISPKVFLRESKELHRCPLKITIENISEC